MGNFVVEVAINRKYKKKHSFPKFCSNNIKLGKESTVLAPFHGRNGKFTISPYKNLAHFYKSSTLQIVSY